MADTKEVQEGQVIGSSVYYKGKFIPISEYQYQKTIENYQDFITNNPARSIDGQIGVQPRNTLINMKGRERNPEGRVMGSYIYYLGRFIPLTQFAQQQGYKSWQDYTTENPITAGRVQIKSKINTNPAEVAQDIQTTEQQTLPDTAASRRYAELRQQQDSRSLGGDSPQFSRVGKGKTIDDQPIYNFPVEPRGGQMETMPRIIPDQNVGGYKFVQEQSSQTSARASYIQSLNRDAISGGNITDIYRSYLGGQ